MSGGILTLAFEAPQAVRTFGVTPVLAVLAGLGLVASLDRLVAVVTIPRVVRAWRQRWPLRRWARWRLAWIGFTNLDTFFNRQMRDPDVFAAFSTRETVPARAALEGGGRYESILASKTMTPSVEAAFLVPDLQATIRQFDPAGDLPYRGQGPAWSSSRRSTIRRLPTKSRACTRMPSANRSERRAAARRSSKASASSPTCCWRAVACKPRIAAQTGRPSCVPKHAPTSIRAWAAHRSRLPAQVTWQGALALDTTGEYSFRIPSGFELRIDDGVVASAAGPAVRVRLVRGNHALRLSGTIAQTAPARLEWLPMGSGGQWQPIPAEVLFLPPAGGLGLRLTLTPGLDAHSQPMEEYVDPVLSHYYHLSPFSRLHLDPQVWTADWVGQLDAPRRRAPTASCSTTPRPPASGSTINRSSAI